MADPNGRQTDWIALTTFLPGTHCAVYPILHPIRPAEELLFVLVQDSYGSPVAPAAITSTFPFNAGIFSSHKSVMLNPSWYSSYGSSAQHRIAFASSTAMTASSSRLSTRTGRCPAKHKRGLIDCHSQCCVWRLCGALRDFWIFYGMFVLDPGNVATGRFPHV